ncbi:hypothetical protein, partial [Pseudomonas aeruginosa]|uniref:hypothetical protein n=1 Tax=Pseudomonas aeruginosa TaxID=287 RepID=UPI00155748EB
MTLPFTRAAWRPLCSAAVLGAALWAAGASAAERRFDLPRHVFAFGVQTFQLVPFC